MSGKHCQSSEETNIRKKLHSGRGLLCRQLDESIGVCGVAWLKVIATFCVHNEIHKELSH